jgi:hypothetical protein
MYLQYNNNKKKVQNIEKLAWERKEGRKGRKEGRKAGEEQKRKDESSRVG